MRAVCRERKQKDSSRICYLAVKKARSRPRLEGSYPKQSRVLRFGENFVQPCNSQHSLRARNPSHSRIDLARRIDSFGESFENRLGHVVRVATVEDFRVEIAAGMHAKCAQEFLDELECKIADA